MGLFYVLVSRHHSASAMTTMDYNYDPFVKRGLLFKTNQK